jgi:hypothetical protein
VDLSNASGDTESPDAALAGCEAGGRSDAAQHVPLRSALSAELVSLP